MRLSLNILAKALEKSGDFRVLRRLRAGFRLWAMSGTPSFF